MQALMSPSQLKGEKLGEAAFFIYFGSVMGEQTMSNKHSKKALQLPRSRHMHRIKVRLFNSNITSILYVCCIEQKNGGQPRHL